MSARAQLGACMAVVGLVCLFMIEPRLHHDFPSMIDDWSAIAKAPDQLRDVLVLRNPEKQRYRPGFVMWNALQWHTLGAPERFVGPQLWNLLRVMLLAVGLTALADLLLRGPDRRSFLDPRLALVVATPLVVLTTPTLAMDFARYGPQEPLMVGGMALGVALLVHAVDRLLEPGPAARGTLLAAVAGAVLWAFGVLQKETSSCVLLLAPFLWPTVRAQRPRWGRLDRERRRSLLGIGAVVLLPFVPIVARSIQLATADERVYESYAAGRSIWTRIWDQVITADDALDTPLFGILLVAALAAPVLVALRRRRVDWLTVGLVVTGVAFVLFAAESGVVVTRYYLPPLALFSLAFARAAAAWGALVTVAAALVLGATGVVHARDARDWVRYWVGGERRQEALVRTVAALDGGGCRVRVTGQNVELVEALPVLEPFAREPPRKCSPGPGVVVVIDGPRGPETPPTDPVLVDCRPAPAPFWHSDLATISQCLSA